MALDTAAKSSQLRNTLKDLSSVCIILVGVCDTCPECKSNDSQRHSQFPVQEAQPPLVVDCSAATLLVNILSGPSCTTVATRFPLRGIGGSSGRVASTSQCSGI